MSSGSIILLMTACFLGFGYMGVPVAFALMAGVLAACMFTPISMQSMIGQMFHGIDSEILLAVPFFLLVGELMTSADVTNRMIRLAGTNWTGREVQEALDPIRSEQSASGFTARDRSRTTEGRDDTGR